VKAGTLTTRQTVAANKRAEKEHRATEKERLRADAEAQRAEALAEENKRLRALLDKR
jgi:cell shape-determining protein MreC